MDRELKNQLEDQLTLVNRAENVDELSSGLLLAARSLGFDYFAYGLQVAVPISAPKVELINNYPELWQQRYIGNNYVSCDPTVSTGYRTTAPFIWSEELFADARPLWEDARAFGLEHGWVQSAFLSSGVAGLLSLSRACEHISAAELNTKTPLLLWFNQLAQLGFQKHLLPSMLPSSELQLTPREAEILRWTADGKTSFEVAMILGIAERTVNFHLGNIVKKFKVNNKVSAAVQAVSLGLI